MEKPNNSKSLVEQLAELLANRGIGDIKSDEPLHKLMEQLRVYHKELETQNQEFYDIYEKNENLINKLEDLFDRAPVAYFVIDAKGDITDVNQTGLQMIGASYGDITGTSFTRFIAPDYHDDFYFFFRRLSRHTNQRQMELVIRPENKKDFWVSLSAISASADKKGGNEYRFALFDISEKKKYAHQSQFRLNVLKNVNYAIITTDNALYIQYTNQVVADLTGYNRQELLNKPIAGLFDDAGWKQVQHALGQHAHQEIQLEIPIVTKKGSTSFISMTVNDFFDEVHQNVGFVYSFIDISDRKEKEILQKRIATIVESAANIICSTNLSGEIITWNKGAFFTLGYAPEEVFHTSVYNLLARDEQAAFEAAFNKALDGKADSFAARFLAKTGELKHLRLTISPLEKLPNAESAVSIIALDITQQRHYRKALEKSEQKYRSIFENSGEGLVLIKNNILDLNESFANLLGYTREELIGKNPVDFSPEIQPDGSYSREKGGDLLHNARKGTVGSFYWQHKNRNGKLIDTEITLSPLEDEHGSVIALIRDITFRKTRERKLKAQKKQIEEQNASYKKLNADLKQTQQKLIESYKELEQSENRFKTYIQSSPAAIFILDKQDRISFYNTAASKMLKLPDQEDYKADIYFTDYIDVTGRINFEEIAKSARKKGFVANKETVLNIAGYKVYVLLNTKQIENNQLVIFAINITENKKAQHQLQEEKLRWERTFANTSDGMLIVDEHFTIIEANEAILRLCRKRMEHVKGHTPYEVIHNSQLQDDYLAPIRSGKKSTSKTLWEDSLGRYLHIKFDSVMGQDYHLLFGVLTVRDITQQVEDEKEIEEQSRNNHHIAQVSRELIKPELSLETTLYLIIKSARMQTGSELAFAGIISSDNQKLLIYRIDEAMGAPVQTNVLRKNGDYFEGFAAECLNRKTAIWENEPATNAGIPDYLFNRRPVHNYAAVPAIFEENVIGLIVVGNTSGGYSLKKVDWLKRLANLFALAIYKLRTEKALIEAKNQAQEADKLKSAFLANMSHEIRTPMNAIIGFSQLLSMKELTDKKRNDYVAIINDRAQHLLQILNDIIDLSKIEANQLDVQMETINLMAFFQKIVEHGEAEIKRKEKNQLKLYVDCLCRDEDLALLSDYSRLWQVITNLITNAVKFTHEGHIKIGAIQASRNIVFWVEDTGIGISREQRDHVFMRFRQLDDKLGRVYEGTGLGLAISKDLVHVLGGRIWLKSTPGKGTVFYVAIPYNKSQQA